MRCRSSNGRLEAPKRLRDVTRHKPVLVGDGYNVDVLTVANNLALTRNDRNSDDDALLRTFRAWLEPLAGSP